MFVSKKQKSDKNGGLWVDPDDVHDTIFVLQRLGKRNADCRHR